MVVLPAVSLARPCGAAATGQSLALVAGLVLALGWVSWRGVPETTPIELRAWILAYPCLVLTVTYPSGSVVRYLMLAIPLALVLVPRREGARWCSPVVAASALLGVALQLVWITSFVGSTAGPIP